MITAWVGPTHAYFQSMPQVTTNSGTHRPAKLVLLYGILLGLCLLIAEATIRIVEKLSPRIAYELASPYSNRALVTDPVLGFRISPFFPEVDSRGYRNNREYSNPDVLAIGDSMTYGYTVSFDKSWPRQLEQMESWDVYNAGVGDYGPCEHLGVYRELEFLNPRVVVLGIFIGNDLSDAYTSIYLENRCTDLKSDDPEVLEQLAKANSESSLRNQALGLGMDDVPWPFLQGLPDKGLMVQYGKDRIALYRLTRAVYHRISDFSWQRFGDGIEDESAFEKSLRKPGAFAYEATPELRTVFRNPEIDMLAVNQNDPRIAEGMRITQQVISSIRDQIDALQAEPKTEFVVALIPSKSLIYNQVVIRDPSVWPDNFLQQIEMDKQVMAGLTEFLVAEGIAFVNTTPKIEDIINANQNPFYLSTNEHTNAKGYRAMAEAIAQYLSKESVLASDRQ